MKFLEPTLVLILAAVLGGGAARAAETAGTLDGMTFIGETGKKGKRANGEDELIFKDGKFRSKACDPYGFAAADYKMTANGDTIVFEAKTFSPKAGRMVWKGTVQGDKLDGTYTWYRVKKWYRFPNAPVEYWIKAALKK